ncbi:MAG: hypothetical protein QM755_24540 [Luteolibacter sp.]
MVPFSPVLSKRRRGFSLLVTLMMMMLLTLLALGLLSLSTITLRGSALEASRMKARSNARCALMLAIGQLQKNLGPDKRISAPSTLAAGKVAPAHEGWHGAWMSDTDTTTSFPQGRQDRFAGWLVSTPPDQEKDISTVAAQASRSVVLERLSDGRETSVPLLDAPEGRLAWWTADEAQKATVDLAEATVTTDNSQIAARHAPARFSPETIATVGTFPKDANTVNRLVTTGQVELAGIPNVPDLNRICTVGARSVLADVRKGGLKRDFSCLFEMPETDITGYGQWTGTNSINDAQAYIYGTPGVAIGARWNHLYAYYNLYKDVSQVSNEPRIQLASKPVIDWRLADQQKDYGDKQGGFRYPRISRLLYVFSYSAVPPTGTSTQYTLRLGVDVYVLLWNPFDVRITWPANTTFLSKFSSGLPFKFNWFLNGTQKGGATRLADIIGVPLFLRSQFQMPGETTFNMAPGETRLFSLAKTTSTFDGASYPDFSPGLYYNDLLFYNNVLGSSGGVTGVGTDRISVGMEPYNETAGYNNKAQYLDFWIYDKSRGWPYYEHRGEIIAEGNTQFTQQLKPLTKDVLPSVTMIDAATKKRPFAAFVMEMKSAGDSTLGTPSFLFSGASRLSSRLSNSNEDFSLDRLEYKLEKMESFQSDLLQCSLPGDANGENHGYIGSGRLPMDGRTHMTALSIPSMPPMSVANLRHASVGDGGACLRATLWAPQNVSCTPAPSYTDLAVGNAYAHPRIAAGSTTATSSGSTLYDHSFLANEALWDSWFFSSLASRTADGSTVLPKTMWSEFVEGRKPLLNPRFSLWKGTDTTDKLRTDVFDGDKIRLEAHRTIASRLLVNGGFNVNSTSVDAWTAFLSSTRVRSIRKLDRNGGGGKLVQAKGTLFSRGDYVLDDAVEDGSGGDSQYSGFRDLSDDQVRKLAAKVVEEVKKRGPFLNVSEFVNRRLGNDAELSLRGTLQAAIDATDLNDKLKALGKPGISSPPSGSFANTKAAELNTSTGAPGWLMQGDILDPLGPLITVRGDTFRIRAYGEATDTQGTVLARAWCEAVVQRTPDYLDRAEAPEKNTPSRSVNMMFGREFRIVGFRWLDGPDA